MHYLEKLATRLASNPITARQVSPHHSARAHVRGAVDWIVVIMCAGHLFFFCVWIFEPFASIAILFMLIATIIIMVVPAAIAATAATQTARDIQSGHFELVCASMVADSEIIWGYIWSAMYRGLKQLAIAFGLVCLRFVIPAVIAVILSDSIAAVLLFWPLALAIIAINTGGLIYNAANLGVWVAIRWRQVSTVAILAPALAFGLQLAWFIVTLIGLGVSANYHMSRNPVAAAILAVIMLMTVWGLHRNTHTAINNATMDALRH